MRAIVMAVASLWATALVAAPQWTIGNGCADTCLPPCRVSSNASICDGNAFWGTMVLACNEDACRGDRALRHLYWRNVADPLTFVRPPAQICPSDEGATCPMGPIKHSCRD